MTKNADWSLGSLTDCLQNDLDDHPLVPPPFKILDDGELFWDMKDRWTFFLFEHQTVYLWMAISSLMSAWIVPPLSSR